ncbi:FtsX-like permease family protein [Streptomyces sp. NPDC047928]|uniref:FtsX-like permease family protein n=1 Tax=unclassified Streptomyces TaxID=2593676 RepID=UPI003719B5E3
MSATAPSSVHVLEDGTALIRSDATAAEPAALAATARLPIVSGSVSDLDDGSIIVNDEWETRGVGRTVDVWLADGTRRSLRIAAVARAGTGGVGVYVTPRNAPGARPDRIDVALAGGMDGAGRAAAEAALREAADAVGGGLLTREAWLRAGHPKSDGTTRTGFLPVLGIALVYTGIALANTLVMAVSDRLRDLAVLRLAGATRWQVLRLVAAEALLVVGVGAVLGALVAGVNLLGMWGALGMLAVWSPVAVPWGAVGAVTAACACLAVVAATVSAAVSLRRPPVEVAGLRE